VAAQAAAIESGGAVRGALRLDRLAPRPGDATRLRCNPVLALVPVTGYVGRPEAKPGVLQAAPDSGRRGGTANDAGVIDGEA
jgi:hypothetical protein